ncbi:MAG TPA: ribbon-helix-helix protein, CopG family [Desulfobacteraceae bacterium]|nr:ribbon-helix-helix protein, CopG family [Desulfobacteraceae bacterium]
MKTTTIRMEDETLDRIDAMAKSLSRSRTWIINQAIERFLSYEEWFIREVNAGLEEMRDGDFASPEGIRAEFQKWGVNAD